MSAYNNGVRAGRNGSDSCPPSYDPFFDPILMVSEETVDRMADDYRSGYEVGTQQRLADEMSKD